MNVITTDELLDKLQVYVAAATGKPLMEPDRALLRSYVVKAVATYNGHRYQEDLTQLSDLHMLKEPLVKVLLALQNPGNADRLVFALGGSIGSIAQEEGLAERYNTTVHALQKIYKALPAPPPTSGRGRPPVTNLLQQLVETLDDYWLRATGEHIAQLFSRSQEPLTLSTQFIHAVVSCVAPGQLRSLKTVTERVVAARNPKKPRRLKTRRKATSIN